MVVYEGNSGKYYIANGITRQLDVHLVHPSSLFLGALLGVHQFTHIIKKSREDIRTPRRLEKRFHEKKSLASFPVEWLFFSYIFSPLSFLFNGVEGDV